MSVIPREAPLVLQRTLVARSYCVASSILTTAPTATVSSVTATGLPRPFSCGLDLMPASHLAGVMISSKELGDRDFEQDRIAFPM